MNYSSMMMMTLPCIPPSPENNFAQPQTCPVQWCCSQSGDPIGNLLLVVVGSEIYAGTARWTENLSLRAPPLTVSTICGILTAR